MKLIVAILAVCTCFFVLTHPARVGAQEVEQTASDSGENVEIPLTTEEEHFEAVVLRIIDEQDVDVFGTSQHIQELQLKILTGERTGKTLKVTSGGLASSAIPVYEKGDKLIISEIIQPDGTPQYFIVDFVRRDALFILFALFVTVTIGVAGKKGLASLGGMIYSFYIIFAFILPNISQGQNPILVALLGGIMIVPVTFYISHGFNNKTHVAIIGTVISLSITGLLSEWAVELAQLTGFASEDASFVQLMSNGSVNIKGLLLAGIIVGLFGILDDITISQAAIVEQLRESSPHMSSSQLYRRSMEVGKDHIGSLVNTLILVYTGAAMPFLLLITAQDQSFLTTINYEAISEEIVRTLTASIGLILAVPITTFIAVKLKVK